MELGRFESSASPTDGQVGARCPSAQEYDAPVKSLAERGVKNLAVITPGFSSDCLETLEEIAMENAEIFRHAGGKNFAAIPCLNDTPGGMAVIRDIVTRELKGWLLSKS